MQFLSDSHKVIPKFKFYPNLYTIIFFFGPFAAFWTGKFLVLATDYNSYSIWKHCPINSDQCK